MGRLHNLRELRGQAIIDDVVLVFSFDFADIADLDFNPRFEYDLEDFERNLGRRGRNGGDKND